MLPYAAVGLVVGTGFAAMEVAVRRVGGRRSLWVSWLGSLLVLSLLAVAYWHQLPARETPLGAYLIAITIPTLLSTWFIDWSSAGRQPLLLQFAGALAVCWMTVLGVFPLALLAAGSL